MPRTLLPVMLLLVGLVACRSPNMTERDRLSSDLPEAAPFEVGATVYAIHCASCHGANLEGEADWKRQNEDRSFRAPPHDDTGHTWHHGDDNLMEAIRFGGARFDNLDIGGTSNMPAFTDILSEEEMAAVLTFIKDSWPDDIRQLQQQATERERAQAGQQP